MLSQINFIIIIIKKFYYFREQYFKVVTVPVEATINLVNRIIAVTTNSLVSSMDYCLYLIKKLALVFGHWQLGIGH